MQSVEVKLINPVGLHARPAAFFVQTAQEFVSEVVIEFNNKSADGKSLLDILTLGAVKGATIKIITNGVDEDDTIKKLVKIVEDGLGEEG
jgi:phosphocarrier protein